jgi:hypothetical protein
MTLVNEHRLYIVLGILFLYLGALFIRRSDAVGATVFLTAGIGIIINGSRALKKHLTPRYSTARTNLRMGLLLLSIVLAIVVIFLQERW